MKKLLTSLLLAALVGMLCIPAFATDGGFNAGVTISPVENDSFTVTVKDSAILAEKKPTLTVPCPAGWANASVSFGGKALEDVSFAGGKVTFPVTKGGVYTVSMGDSKVPFTDVSTTAFYYDAMVWAYENNITSGTSATTFSPGASCNRGQAVTFLWNLAGKPEPTDADCPFTDIREGAYYYKAVLWACAEGITAGTSATTFSPGVTVNRAQAVTFLYRYAGEPAVSGSNTFTDVKEANYFYRAVIWALEQGITKGTSDTAFSPGSPCNRGQLVTFLYRFAV